METLRLVLWIVRAGNDKIKEWLTVPKEKFVDTSKSSSKVQK